MDQFEKYEQLANCAVCEAMLPEAVDGALSPAEQLAFDKHVAGCMECAQELAEARRGAAWLGMLKSRAPEPPASLLANILADIQAEATANALWTVPQTVVVPTMATPSKGWGSRIAGIFSFGSGSMLQPRLAMTAAMAFFSIALTLNLTGVRLRDVRAEDFTPSGIKRTLADTTASLTRSVQNNKSVYQMESRLSELREEDAPQQSGGSGR
jgi:hypothetical protein